MVRKSNKGMSLVEVLFALAIFLIMMIPLVKGLISGIKSTDDSKKLQSRNEYARLLMENVKEVPTDVLQVPADAKDFFESLGSEDIASAYDAGNDAYQITGSVQLGTQKKKYTYAIDMKGDANTASIGNMEDLDPEKVALISASLANYDTVAAETFVTMKLDALQVDEDSVFTNETKIDTFRKDTANRTITIKVEGNAVKGFEVSCGLEYKDSGIAKTLSYLPYNKHFKKLPNIYFMYNVGVYNDNYMNDKIEYDLSGLTDLGAKDKVNIYVIQTAEDYTTLINPDTDDFYTGQEDGENIIDVSIPDSVKKNRKNAKDQNKGLYKSPSVGDRTGKVEMAASKTANVTDHLKIYHNIDSLNCDATIAPLVNNLDKAESQKWSRYSIRVWIQEGDNVNKDDKFVVLEGTRGGGEIE